MAAFVGVTGAYCPGRVPQFGIGLMRQGENSKENSSYLFWGSSTSHLLVTAWRAARIVDMITDVRESVLFAAFTIASRVRAPKFQSYVETLSRAMPQIVVEDLRTMVLSEWLIADAELERMLKICNVPDANIKVSAQELQEELVEGIIHCTAEVCRVFDRAELEGEKLSHIAAMSRLPLPVEQSFRELCRQAKLRHLCTYSDDELMKRKGLMGIDQYLVYRSYRYGTGRNILCVAKCYGRFEWLGNPVVRLRRGDEWILREVSYCHERMMLDVYALSGKESGRSMTVSVPTLVSLKPRMVGLTFADDEPVSTRDRERGYYSTEPWWRRLRGDLRRST